LVDFVNNLINLFINDFTTKELVVAIATIVGVLFTLKVSLNRYLENNRNWIIDKHFTSKESIDYHIKDIGNKIIYTQNIYKYVLNLFLSKIDYILGRNKLINKKAFIKILSLSYIYSTLAFMLSWFLGGNGSIGNITIIKNDISVKARLSVVDASLSIILFFIIIGLATYIYDYYKYQIKNDKVIFKSKHISKSNQYSPIYFITFFYILIGYFLLKNNVVEDGLDILYFVAALNYIWFLILMIILPGIILFYLKDFLDERDNVSKRLLLSSIMLLLTLFIFFYNIAGNKFLIVVFLFMIFLPFINAIFDYISIYISRLFAKNILITNSILKIAIEICLDAIIAVGLFFLLSYTLMEIFQYLNINFNLSIPIEYYKTLLFTDPFNPNVLWITIMFISTLIPTLMHILLGLLSIPLNIIFKPHLQELIDDLKKLQPNDPNMPFKENIARKIVYERTKKIIVGYYGIVFLFVVIILLIIWIISIKKNLI